MLLEKNSDVNYECKENKSTGSGSTPLLKAIEKKYFGTVKMLIEHNANVN